MTSELEFRDLLRLIDDRSVAFRAAVAAAPTLDRQPLPIDVALDGVEEFLSTCCATTSPWPHEPAVVDYEATAGSSTG